MTSTWSSGHECYHSFSLPSAPFSLDCFECMAYQIRHFLRQQFEGFRIVRSQWCIYFKFKKSLTSAFKITFYLNCFTLMNTSQLYKFQFVLVALFAVTPLDHSLMLPPLHMSQLSTLPWYASKGRRSSLESAWICDLGALNPVELCRCRACRLRNRLVFVDPTETILITLCKMSTESLNDFRS